MLIIQINMILSGLHAHVTHSTKDFARRKGGVRRQKWRSAKQRTKKENRIWQLIIVSKILILNDTIVEKIGLDMSVPAFRKACSRAKKDDSLDPTPAKAPPTSEPAAPTPSKYPKGGFHDQVMAAASL